MGIQAMSRPARIDSDVLALDNEYRSARYLYHRLLDFEDQHQKMLDETAERVAPDIVRTARLIAILLGRAKRRERTVKGTWSPNPHPDWLPGLRYRLVELRNVRNASIEWKLALKWGDTPAEDAPARGGIRRKSGETDEEFEERTAKRRDKLTRREAWRKSLYDAHVAVGATERSRVYWGTWNALLKSLDQARQSVLDARKRGMTAEWRRPRWDDPLSIAADAGGFRIVDRGGGTTTSRNGATAGNPWWTIEQRLASGWVRFRAKVGNWHELPSDAELRTCKLTRRKRGRSWEYSVSICIGGMPTERTFAHNGKRELLDGKGLVALDWGHREFGHPMEWKGLRVFTWRGEDGEHGEILLPGECRDETDAIDAMKSRVDAAFAARKKTLGIREKHRAPYRNHLLRSGVLTTEQATWIRWEERYERRMERSRRRIVNLRRETYTAAIRMLRRRYGVFAIEDETTTGHRRSAKEEQMLRRKRSNRELSARYEFTQLCERLGAEILPVPSRNSTRECPRCGKLGENTADLEIVCPHCGVAEDKDQRACVTILKRAKEALAKRSASSEKKEAC